MTQQTAVRLLTAAIVAFASGAVTGYQAGRQQTQPPGIEGAIVFPAGTVLSGQDLGFRVLGSVNGVNRGRLVVRADGRWIDIQLVQ